MQRPVQRLVPRVNILDLIFNIVCLLLWLNWRSQGLAALPSRPPALELVGTLRRAGPSPRERWSSPLVLAGVLVLRAFLYWQFAQSARWIPQISLPAFVIHFRPDVFALMLVFSVLSFAIVLGAFYFSLLLVAAVNHGEKEREPWTALVRAHLGLFARLPAWASLALPFIAGFLFWLGIGPLLALLQVHSPIRSFGQLCGQAAVVGIGAWLLWKYVLVVLLGLHIISSYVYLGNTPFWNFIGLTARRLLRPLAWLPLRVGRIDLTPFVALALVVVAATYAPRALAAWYRPG